MSISDDHKAHTNPETWPNPNTITNPNPNVSYGTYPTNLAITAG